MTFNMGFSKGSLEGPPPVPEGFYTLILKGFKQSKSKNGDSVNLNPEIEIVGNSNPEFNGRKVFESMNVGGAWVVRDLVHACGFPMEVVKDGNEGTDAENQQIPGIFEKADQFPEDPSQWKYQGPLLNRTFQAELAISEYQGRKSNKIRQFICQVSGCQAKHSTNLLK